MGTSPFRVKKSGHLAWLILNRPKARNAMNLAFFEELPGIMADLDRDDSVRVVIIRGEGDSFSAGIDLSALRDILADAGAAGRDNLRRVILNMQEAITSVERCRKPVIAAAHSHCLGGGVDLLAACDIRLASKDTVFGIRETRMAIIADLGTLQRLPALIGSGRARELALTGRDFTAQEALEMGFITSLCQDREELHQLARGMATQIAANSPVAVQGTKETILYTRDNGIRAGLEFVAQKNAVALHCNDLKEAVQAFMEKRKPDYKGD